MGHGHEALEESLCRSRDLADLVLRRLVISQCAEVHEAAGVATPQILRVRRERQDRARDFLCHASLEHPLVRLKGAPRVAFDLVAGCFARLFVDRLERVRTRLADLSTDVLWNVELRLDFRVSTAPLVVRMA